MRHAAAHHRVAPGAPARQLPPRFFLWLGVSMCAVAAVSVVGGLLEYSSSADSKDLVFAIGMGLFGGLLGLVTVARFVNPYQEFHDDKVVFRDMLRRVHTIEYGDIVAHKFVSARAAGNEILIIEDDEGTRLRVHLGWTDATPLLRHLGVAAVA